MTRASLNRRLALIYLICAAVLSISLAARLAKFVPGVEGSALLKAAPLVYDYMRDMALVFVTMVAAYLANVFQKRTKFVASLEEEWRAMVKTKSKLMAFCQRDNTTLDDYLDVYGRMSATLDNMRIVYRNVGETEHLVGLYPYTPLHDMRRALESIDPRANTDITYRERNTAHRAIQQSFEALRETFLEELDLEEPTHGLLVSGARRSKKSGATRRARSIQRGQTKRLGRRAKAADGDDAVTTMLSEAYKREQEQEGVARKTT